MNRSQKIFKLVEESDLIALVYTEEVSSSANQTFVKFNKVPPKEIVQAAINMTDGDYNLTGKDLVLNHRTITGKQRTINIAKALRRAGVRVDEIRYHGELVGLEKPWPSEQWWLPTKGAGFPPVKIQDSYKTAYWEVGGDVKEVKIIRRFEKTSDVMDKDGHHWSADNSHLWSDASSADMAASYSHSKE